MNFTLWNADNKRTVSLAMVYLFSLLLRMIVFYAFIAPGNYYRQPDSNDYHVCAIALERGMGMHRPDTGRPLFWRTPGYPIYLTPFYKMYGVTTGTFEGNKKAQQASIWVQIFLTSLIPVIAFFLTLLLTHNNILSWIVCILCALHPGFILASTYLLTDALAHLLFLLFLYFLYKSFTAWQEPKNCSSKQMIIAVLCAALFLALYTWFRPIGRYIAVVSTVIMLLGNCSWKDKLCKIALFIATFSLLIAPWYIRNHTLTGHYFFCPMSGPYLQTFVAPKIIRRLTGKPLIECINMLMKEVHSTFAQERKFAAVTKPGVVIPIELICADVARPWVWGYPGYFILEWMNEVIKTTFDLYASQLVSIANGTFFYDPPEEFLVEKLALALYKQTMPIIFHLLAWLELLFSLFIWIGIASGCMRFLMIPLITLIQTKTMPVEQRALFMVWLKIGIMIGAVLFMTGGFGYARLRMPIEPLLWILSLTWWYAWYTKKDPIL